MNLAAGKCFSKRVGGVIFAPWGAPKSSICSLRHFYKLPLVPKSPHTPLLGPLSLVTGPLATDIQGTLALWTCHSMVPLNPCHSPGTGMLMSIPENSPPRLRRYNLPKRARLRALAETKFTQRSATSRDTLPHTHTPGLVLPFPLSFIPFLQIFLYCYPTNFSIFIPRVSNHPPSLNTPNSHPLSQVPSTTPES